MFRKDYELLGMEESKKRTLSETVATNGIPIYIFLLCLAFAINRVLNTAWSANAPLVILAIYVLYVLIGTFSKKIEPILKIDQKLLLGYLLIIPLMGTCILGIVCIVFSKQLDSTNSWGVAILDWFKNSGNISLLVIFFSLFVVIGYFQGYKVEKDSSNLNSKETILEEVRCSCKFSDTEKEKISIIDEKVDRLDDILINKHQMGYTATCIPVKYNKDNETFVFVLIKNMSHSKAQWMFPGSHVEVSNNQFSNSNIDLMDINIIPSEVIREKVKKEAGLEEIRFIDPNYKFVNPDAPEEVEFQYPNTCWPVEAPVFNYLFRVSECANCYINHGHRCHYDFTYVGEYNTVNPDIAEYDQIEMQFNLDRLSLKSEDRQGDIEYIRGKLQDNINKKIGKSNGRKTNKNRNGRQIITVDNLCLDSIPQMIYNTILFYKDYKGI